MTNLSKLLASPARAKFLAHRNWTPQHFVKGWRKLTKGQLSVVTKTPGKAPWRTSYVIPLYTEKGSCPSHSSLLQWTQGRPFPFLNSALKTQPVFHHFQMIKS
jgi:hypothetical protein